MSANSDDVSRNSPRRKAVKTILAGSAALGGAVIAPKWHKPVIDAVVVPAHAQTTTENCTMSDPTCAFSFCTIHPQLGESRVYEIIGSYSCDSCSVGDDGTVFHFRVDAGSTANIPFSENLIFTGDGCTGTIGLNLGLPTQFHPVGVPVTIHMSYTTPNGTTSNEVSCQVTPQAQDCSSDSDAQASQQSSAPVFYPD